MKKKNKVFLLKILTILFLVLVYSCKRTNLNKYIIRHANFKIYSLSKEDRNNYSIDSVIINDSKKKYLIIFTIQKLFVSDNPDKNGYPNEGMEGRLDSVISSNIILKSKNDICVYTKEEPLYNISNKNFLKNYNNGTLCLKDNIDFSKFINYYNKINEDEYYGSEIYYIPFVVNYDDYRNILSKKLYIKVFYKNKIRTIYIS
jgi:hypothetical protein